MSLTIGSLLDMNLSLTTSEKLETRHCGFWLVKNVSPTCDTSGSPIAWSIGKIPWDKYTITFTCLKDY